jgi:hypothetical protein
MDIQTGDRIVDRRLAGRGLIVVAICEDPSRAWVVDSLDHGLVNGNAYVIDLDKYRALKVSTFVDT